MIQADDKRLIVLTRDRQLILSEFAKIKEDLEWFPAIDREWRFREKDNEFRRKIVNSKFIRENERGLIGISRQR